MKRIVLIALASIFALTAYASSNYKVVENMSRLKLSFTDPVWNGKKVPPGQQCRRFGGKDPKTPELKVMEIPPDTNAIVIEFSDRSYAPMDNGGHGEIGYEINQGTETVVIQSISGHSFDLPTDFFLVAAHKAPKWDDAGAYLPPCSGGKGNSYYATVKAIHREASKSKIPLLLAEGVIQMGSY